MSFVSKETIEKQMNPVVTLIPLDFLDTLLVLSGKLKGKDVEWTIDGNLGEALQTVHVEPDCIEILTSKQGAKEIFDAVQEYKPKKVRCRTEKLPRTAILKGEEYSVFMRSYYFEFKLNSLVVKVYGDLQYRIADWEWGNKIKFQPEEIYVLREKMRVVPLPIKYKLYRGLGWDDRAEKVMRVLARSHCLQRR